MSNTDQTTKLVEVILVNVLAKDRQLYIGDGIKPGGKVVFESEDRYSEGGHDVTFEKETPLSIRGSNTASAGVRFGIKKGEHLVGEVSPSYKDPTFRKEGHFPFIVESGAGGIREGYRLAFSEKGHVEEVVFHLDGLTSQDVHYKGTQGSTMLFLFMPQDLTAYLPSINISPTENSYRITLEDPRILAAIAVQVAPGATGSQKVAHIKWQLEGQALHKSTPSQLHTSETETGGTDSVDIYVDPDDG